MIQRFTDYLKQGINIIKLQKLLFLPIIEFSHRRFLNFVTQFLRILFKGWL